MESIRIGGALLGHSDDLKSSTEAFMEKIKERFSERLDTPEREFLSACDLSDGQQTTEILNHLVFREDFSWHGRNPTVYKASRELPFQDVSRFELIGKTGGKEAFDLRYFQIEPGGYTSLEKHLHTHTVICIRGQGVLFINDRCIPLKPFDIAYISPMDVHQLRNESSEPFGFFCIVDRQRDRPMKP